MASRPCARVRGGVAVAVVMVACALTLCMLTDPAGYVHALSTGASQRPRVVMGLLFYPRGGSAHVARNLAATLPGAGWDVTVLSGSLTPARSSR